MADIVDFNAFRDRKKSEANPPAPAPVGPFGLDIADPVLMEIADLCIHEAQSDDFMLKLDALLDERDADK